MITKLFNCDKGCRYSLVGLFSLFLLFILGYSFYSSSRMINAYAPIVDATMEVKYEATLAHLWFEEIISGDRYEDIEMIYAHIDEAIWYAQAILDGGENAEGTFIAITDTNSRNEVSSTIKLLNDFKELTKQRYDSKAFSGIGTEVDQRYDQLFRSLLLQIDHVETVIQKKIKGEFQQYRIIQLILLLAALCSIVFVFFILYLNDREQKKYISELNKAKELSENNEKWLNETLSCMADGVIITDSKGLVTYLNPAACQLTGWTQEEALLQDISIVFNVICEKTQESALNVIKSSIDKKVVNTLVEGLEIVQKNGDSLPINVNSAPIIADNAELQGVVVVFHDVSLQKETEKENKKLEIQLRQALKMEAIGTLAGGIAHDFNNVLTIIIGNIEMAAKDISDESKAHHQIAQALSAANRAGELVKQILSFSRKTESNKKVYSLKTLVSENLAAIAPTVPSSTQILFLPQDDVKNQCSLDHNVMVDPVQIQQLVFNLCINAVQAMDETGKIQIDIEKVDFSTEVPFDRQGLAKEQYELLTISDSGPGISKDIITRIFDPFFTTKDVNKGTGMGLAVVHGIMESHGGKIFVKSVLGEGTTFYMYFPTTSRKLESNFEEEEVIVGGGENILFVDDEVMLSKLGKTIIEEHGYTVTAFNDSNKALEAFKNNPERFDLVITDQTMPNLTGSELAQKILEIQPDLPIILASGFSSKIDKNSAKDIGIKEFVEKPYESKKIVTLIRKVLDGE